MKIKIDFGAMLATFIVLFCNAGVLGIIKGSMGITLLVYTSVALWVVWVFLYDIKCFKHFLHTAFPLILLLIILFSISLFSSGQVLVATKHLFKNILFLLLFLLMMMYYSYPQRSRGRKIILYTWFIDIVISAIYTIYRLVENPMLSRLLATGDIEKHIHSTITTAGVLGYGNIYGLSFIVIALYCVIKNARFNKKIVLILCAILFSYTILQAQFFIAVIITIIGMILNLIFEERNFKKRYFWIIGLIPTLIIACIIMIYFLPNIISSNVLPDMISTRLAILYTYSVEDILLLDRGIVYLKSLTAIVNTYGLGIVFLGNDVAGGHSELLDLIANYGIFITLIFIYGIWKVKSRINSIIPKDSYRNNNIVWCMFIVYSFLNPSLWCPTTLCLILLIPLMHIELKKVKYIGDTI